jgi:hypothetical protein
VLRSIVLAAVKEVQDEGGRTWKEITGASKVIGVVDGFDSINGIEATGVIERIVIEKGLGTKVNAETLFTDGRRAHTVDEAVEILAKSILVGA